jgi:hypothetical protein
MIPEEQPDTIRSGEETKRLAIQNCEWDKISAVDLLTVLQSFCPAGKTVKTVTIYLSDFGKEAIDKETKYGPQGIWKSGTEEETSDVDSEKDQDVYDHIDLIGDGSVTERSDDDEGSDQEGALDKEDFKRPPGVTGLVLHDELMRRQRRRKRKSSNDLDDIALRIYERQRLKYYFAIAELDSVSSAISLYEELDGMEFEHSSMTMDLRFVPDDVK